MGGFVAVALVIFVVVLVGSSVGLALKAAVTGRRPRRRYRYSGGSAGTAVTGLDADPYDRPLHDHSGWSSGSDSGTSCSSTSGCSGSGCGSGCGGGGCGSS